MYNLKSLQGQFTTDTFYAGMKYLRGNTCCQVYSHKFGLSACHPKLNLRGASLGETLDGFVHNFGVPKHLTFDGFQTQVGGNRKLNKNLRRYRINHHIYAL